VKFKNREKSERVAYQEEERENYGLYKGSWE